MIKYQIVGRRGIGAHKTGEIVDSDDLAGANIKALLDGGHIAVTTPIKPKPDLAAGKEE